MGDPDLFLPSWLIGVSLSLIGCSLSNLGVNMQKYAHVQIQSAKTHKTLCSHPMWICGLLCLIIGSLADLVSFGFADMSLLAPLGAMTLVVNMFIAPCFNKEHLTKRDIIATFIILGGTVLSISFGSKSSSDYTLSELINMYTQTPFVVYICVLTGILICVLALLRKVRARGQKDALSALEHRFEALSYPVLAGTFGAHSVLFAKSSAEMVKSTLHGHNQFAYPLVYLMFALLGFFLYLQMKSLNEGLSKADALLIVPLYQVSWVLMNTVVGMTYFQDYKQMDGLGLAMFFVGLVVTLLGVYLLSTRDLKVRRMSMPDLTVAPIAIEESVQTIKDLAILGSSDEQSLQVQDGEVEVGVIFPESMLQDQTLSSCSYQYSPLREVEDDDSQSLLPR